MNKSLRNRYDSKQSTTNLNERIQSADKHVIYENHVANILLEAMDQRDLERATEIIDKLRSMKGKGLPSLDSGIDKAIADINKFTGGGALTNVLNSFKEKLGFDNPLVKFMTFANMLETGFSQIPNILKNALGEIKPEMGSSTLNVLLKDEASLKTLQDNIFKALSPRGIFGSFKNIPYVDKKALTMDMMKIPLKNLNVIVKQSASGAKTAEIANDIASTIKGQGDVETKGSGTTSSAEPTTASSSAKPSKGSVTGTTTTKAGETVQSTPEDRVKRIISKAGPTLKKFGIKNGSELISDLDKLGIITEPE